MTIVLSEPCSLENELTRLDLLLDAARRAATRIGIGSENREDAKKSLRAYIDLQRALQLYGIEV